MLKLLFSAYKGLDVNISNHFIDPGA